MGRLSMNKIEEGIEEKGYKYNKWKPHDPQFGEEVLDVYQNSVSLEEIANSRDPSAQFIEKLDMSIRFVVFDDSIDRDFIEWGKEVSNTTEFSS